MNSTGEEELFDAFVYLGGQEIWKTQILETISNTNNLYAMHDVERVEKKVINAFAAAKFGGGLPNPTQEK